MGSGRPSSVGHRSPPPASGGHACNGNEYRLDLTGCSTRSSWRSCSAASSRCFCSRVRRACSARGSSCAGSRSTPTRLARRRFPGLVLADGIGFSAPLGAFARGARVRVRGRAARPAPARRATTASPRSSSSAALAGGVVLASDVFHSGAHVDSLLFGSLLATGTRDLVLAGAASAAAILPPGARARAGSRADSTPQLRAPSGLRSQLPDAALLVLVAFAVVASLTAIGALLSAALFVVPAATVRLWTRACARGSSERSRSRQPRASPGCGCRSSSTRLRGRRSRSWAAPSSPCRCCACGSRRRCAGGRSRPCVPPRWRSRSRLRRERVAQRSGPAGRGDDDADRRLARAVGGDAAGVHQILQPNTDPHEYEPRPADVEAVAGAAVVLVNGDGLDAWMSTVLSNSGASPTVVDLGAGCPCGCGDERRRGGVPLRPALVARPAQRRGGSRRDPRRPRRGRPEARDDLPHERRRVSGSSARARRRNPQRASRAFPTAQRKLVTDHDAFGYFAHRYGIAVVGAVIPSQTTQAQASAEDIAALVRLVRREHVARSSRRSR